MKIVKIFLSFAFIIVVIFSVFIFIPFICDYLMDIPSLFGYVTKRKHGFGDVIRRDARKVLLVEKKKGYLICYIMVHILVA